MHQNIYFQKEVWDKFNNELNKSNLINKLLRDYYELGGENKKPTGGAISNSSVPSPKEQPEIPECCTNTKKRCNHWLWDGINSKYTNKYSGEVVEVYY